MLSLRHPMLVCAVLGTFLIAGCGSSSESSQGPKPSPAARSARAPSAPKFTVPPLLNPHDVYAADRPGMLSPVVRHFPERVYVPNSESDTVSVIDPRSFKVIDEFPVGALPQHVTPSYDLRTLWVDNDEGNSLTPIDPATGKPGKPVPVTDPYNLYFTPDGRYAIVVAERMERLDFRDPQTMRLHHSVKVPCPGVDHMDFSADGSFFVASCEFGAGLIKVDLRRRGWSKPVAETGSDAAGRQALPRWPRLLRRRHDVRRGLADRCPHLPQDRLHRDRRRSPWALREPRLPLLYVSNREEGSVSVISFANRRVVRKWTLPGGGSPDMGGVSADGKVLWLSGRYNAEVYAISTSNGRLLARIPVGSGPHGLSVFPQPGRYSLGHTGVFR